MLSSTPVRSDSCFLFSVVSEVRELLSGGARVFLCGMGNDSYRMRISGIRVTRNSKLLQVQTCFGWSTVWSWEQLEDEHGICLYRSPNFHELHEALSEEAFLSFVEGIGLLSEEFKVKEVF